MACVLPREILLEIFLLIDPIRNYGDIVLTCKTFLSFINDNEEAIKKRCIRDSLEGYRKMILTIPMKDRKELSAHEICIRSRKMNIFTSKYHCNFGQENLLPMMLSYQKNVINRFASNFDQEEPCAAIFAALILWSTLKGYDIVITCTNQNMEYKIYMYIVSFTMATKIAYSKTYSNGNQCFVSSRISKLKVILLHQFSFDHKIYLGISSNDYVFAVSHLKNGPRHQKITLSRGNILEYIKDKKEIQ
jgi:hypothetical protein